MKKENAFLHQIRFSKHAPKRHHQTKNWSIDKQVRVLVYTVVLFLLF